MKDGHLNKSKECAKKDVRAERLDPVQRERIREYDRIRGCRNKPATPTAQFKRSVRTIIGNALRDGRIVKVPCEICGNPKSQAHHDDYSKPLEVRWLCFTHHREFAHDQIVGPIT
jgi:hypothetical protein